MTLRLVVFDVDGTLVDSQAEIVAAMGAAFGAQRLPAPDRKAILSVVGLSLPQAFDRLAADQSEATQNALAADYKQAYFEQRVAGHTPALYPGIRALLDQLAGREDLLLGVATGKSRRGLTALLEAHGLERHFVTTQVADDHPSKPHPSMLMTALAETGTAPSAAVMVGDTTYDIEMGRNARMATVGVRWGYHPVSALRAASVVAEEVAQLENCIGLALEGTS